MCLRKKTIFFQTQRVSACNVQNLTKEIENIINVLKCAAIIDLLKKTTSNKKNRAYRLNCYCDAYIQCAKVR